MYVRYEVPDMAEGIFGALEDILMDSDDDITLLLRLTGYFEGKLTAPSRESLYAGGLCWFTQKGNRRFHKGIVSMVKELEARGYHVRRRVLPTVDESYILYQDKYQAVLKPTV